MENRSSLVVGVVVTHADGTGECEAAIRISTMFPKPSQDGGADKAYDTTDFIAAFRKRKVTPHVAQNDG